MKRKGGGGGDGPYGSGSEPNVAPVGIPGCANVALLRQRVPCVSGSRMPRELCTRLTQTTRDNKSYTPNMRKTESA